MKQEQQALWKKIQDFELDDPDASFPFSKKLAGEANWSMAFTLLAIAEYKKFLLLCCISPQGASPSEVVDQVWHMHLTYTRNYWDELCSKVIGQPLHHYPGNGEVEQQKKYQAWYGETLQLYIKVFGQNPPPAIWPLPEERELSKIAMEYKKSIQIPANVWMRVSGAIFIFLLVTQLRFSVFNPSLLPASSFLEFMFFMSLAGIGIALLLLAGQGRGFKKLIQSTFPATFMNYSMIDAVHKGDRALQTAIVELVDHQLLEVKSTKKFIPHLTGDRLMPANNPLVPALMPPIQVDMIPSEDNEFSYDDLRKLYHVHRPESPDLWKYEWLTLQTFNYRWVPYQFVMLFLFIRLIQGAYHHQPVGFLLLGIFLFTVLYGFTVSFYNPAAMLKEGLHKIMKEGLASQTHTAPANGVTANFSYRGARALAGLKTYAALAGIFALGSDSSKVTSDASRDSGAGGCGGCGG